MLRRTSLWILAIGPVFWISQNSAFGQTSLEDPKPNTNQTGYTGQALRNLYQSDIGQGFSSQSQNNLTLQNQHVRVPYVGQSTWGQNTSAAPARPAPRISTGLAPTRTTKPFAGVNSAASSPAVSPYMNLFREDFDGSSDFNYQTLVRPQLQQMQVNQQFERQNLELNKRVQSISAQSAYQNPAGSEQQYPTGHQTVFMYHGRYYPALAQPRRRQQ
jgi:hypothetical protein